MIRTLALVAVVSLAACGPRSEGAPDSAAAAAPLTGRARDSAIAASRLPGAKGVGNALRASDSATARAARLDSASQAP